jgi:hypothetical protein
MRCSGPLGIVLVRFWLLCCPHELGSETRTPHQSSSWQQARYAYQASSCAQSEGSYAMITAHYDVINMVISRLDHCRNGRHTSTSAWYLPWYSIRLAMYRRLYTTF